MNEHNVFSESEKLLRMSEVARILGISKTTAYRLVQNRELNCIRFGGTVRVRQNDLDRFILDHLVPSSGPLSEAMTFPAPLPGSGQAGRSQGGNQTISD